MLPLSRLAESCIFKWLGYILGYRYPELTIYIENDNILPVSSISPAESYQKYRKNKTSGFISASIEASYLLKELEGYAIPLNNNGIFCVYSPSMDKLTIQRINTAIDTLKAQEQFKQY